MTYTVIEDRRFPRISEHAEAYLLQREGEPISRPKLARLLDVADSTVASWCADGTLDLGAGKCPVVNDKLFAKLEVLIRRPGARNGEDEQAKPGAKPQQDLALAEEMENIALALLDIADRLTDLAGRAEGADEVLALLKKLKK